MRDSFSAKKSLRVGDRELTIAHLPSLESAGFDISRLPYSMRILLENLLRREDGAVVPAEDIEAVAKWDPTAAPSDEIAFAPARVLLQDFTGVPAVVDLAALRGRHARLGGDAQEASIRSSAGAIWSSITPCRSTEFGSGGCLSMINARSSSSATRSATKFLKWEPGQLRQLPGRAAGDGHRSPGQPRVPGARRDDRRGRRQEPFVYPDTLVGTDSHTTMINGHRRPRLGRRRDRGRGRDARPADLMLIADVVGFKLTGRAPRGRHGDRPRARGDHRCCASHGVVGKFVEFYGAGSRRICRSPTARRSPTWRPSTAPPCGFFPVDDRNARLHDRETGTATPGARDRSGREAYTKEQGLFRTADSPEPRLLSETLELDMSDRRAGARWAPSGRRIASLARATCKPTFQGADGEHVQGAIEPSGNGAGRRQRLRRAARERQVRSVEDRYREQRVPVRCGAIRTSP